MEALEDCEGEIQIVVDGVNRGQFGMHHTLILMPARPRRATKNSEDDGLVVAVYFPGDPGKKNTQ